MSINFLGDLFDLSHNLYIIFSLTFTFFALFLGKKYLKKDYQKERYLKFWALATFFLHISLMWVEFLKYGVAYAYDNVLFPIYFCNLAMYILMIAAFISNKKSKVFQYFAVVVSYSGILGALISLFYPEYYLGAESMLEWAVMKSMLSHSAMLIGASYLIVGGFIKIEHKNTLIYGIGILAFGVVGLIVNLTFHLAGLPAPNAMFLQKPPIEEAPFLNVYVIVLLMLLVVSGLHYLYFFVTKKVSKKELVKQEA